MPIASAVVDHLVQQISHVLLPESVLSRGFPGKLVEWGSKLRMIQAVMADAEEKQLSGDPDVDRWVSNLREFAYDMEDLLEDFTLLVKRNEAEAQTPYREIKKVDLRLERVLQDIPALGLNQNTRSSPRADFGKPHFATTALRESMFIGREKQLEKLRARLSGIEPTEDSIRPIPPFTVVSIVGTGGVGKTTLAQQLYNHETVREVFQLTAWTCVSDFFDRIAITQNILEQVAPFLPHEGEDIKWLQSSLKMQLSGKKFLFVLDDVGNGNYDELESFFEPLYSGSGGSKIILTTRESEVAMLAGDRNPMNLYSLPLKEGLSLLAYQAIGQENFESMPHLQDIAEQLVKRCQGLPLALSMIGRLLHFGADEERWLMVSRHDIWNREGGDRMILPALTLSYIGLPIHLKRCFAACALFPEDYLFDSDELIQLWMIQGLLVKGNSKTCRDVGMYYLRQLECRMFLQKARNEKARYCMHNLVNNFAKSIVGDTYFSSDECRGDSMNVSPEKVRHAALVSQSWKRYILRKGDAYHSMIKLRTFMPFRISEGSSNFFVDDVLLHDLIMKLKRLRMLTLRYFCVTNIPHQIGELKLLRSIDFSYTNVAELPESICDLFRLQSLLLRGCKKLMKLPRDIHKLTSLLHLDIINTGSLKEMPPHIGNLTNLEILSRFEVIREDGQESTDLRSIEGLERELDIGHLPKAEVASLQGKEGISKLSLDQGSINEVLRSEEHQFMLLDKLQPPRKIEFLSIHHYGGKEFPLWFRNSCLDNVMSITLMGCKSVKYLPPFGRLPLLEILDISGLEAVSMIGDEFYEAKESFRSLKSLSFKDMRAWEKWSSYRNQPFPGLHKLTLSNCPELREGLPGRLDSLFMLEIKECPLLCRREKLVTSGGTLSLPSLKKMHLKRCNVGLLKCLVGVTSMTEMTIQNIPQFINFDRMFSSSWEALEEIQIKDCSQFKSFAGYYGWEQAPTKLKKLVIRNCEDFKKLPDDLYLLTSLCEIIVAGCPKLSSIPSAGYPPSLRKVVLVDCPSLAQSQFINTGKLPESLEELTQQNLKGLESITHLPMGSHLSRFLRQLFIHSCSSLTTLPDSLRHMSSLSELRVSDCQVLELNCFPALPRNLLKFRLDSCPKVKSLHHGMHSLRLLKVLVIRSCDNIRWLPMGGLPPNLEWLWITNCQNLNQPLEQWGLSRLTILRVMVIGGGMQCVDEMECFPSANPGEAWSLLLPSSLIKLRISDMKKVTRLADGLSTHLPMLQELHIVGCPEMSSLSDEGLPSSLEWLHVSSCDMLKDRYLDHTEVHSSHLRRIPRVTCN